MHVGCGSVDQDFTHAHKEICDGSSCILRRTVQDHDIMSVIDTSSRQYSNTFTVLFPKIVENYSE